MAEDIKLGMFVRADRTGLGIQTYNAWKYMKPTKTMIIDIEQYNGNKLADI